VSWDRLVELAPFFSDIWALALMAALELVRRRAWRGPSDASLARLDADGRPTWSHRYGDQGNQVGLDVAVDPLGRVAVLAHDMGDIDFGGGPLASGEDAAALAVARLDASGEHLWSRVWSGPQGPARVAIGPDGSVTVVGQLTRPADLGLGLLVPEAADALVLHLAP
jgi:hypothetical protein